MNYISYLVLKAFIGQAFIGVCSEALFTTARRAVGRVNGYQD